MKNMLGAFLVFAVASAIVGCEVRTDGGGGFSFGNAPRKPSVPVELTLRDSAWGEGMVARFHNQTNHQLTVTVVAENAMLHQRREWTLNLQPNATQEIGWLEGWKFESGERVTVSHSDYAQKSWTIK